MSPVIGPEIHRLIECSYGVLTLCTAALLTLAGGVKSRVSWTTPLIPFLVAVGWMDISHGLLPPVIAAYESTTNLHRFVPWTWTAGRVAIVIGFGVALWAKRRNIAHLMEGPAWTAVCSISGLLAILLMSMLELPVFHYESWPYRPTDLALAIPLVCYAALYRNGIQWIILELALSQAVMSFSQQPYDLPFVVGHLGKLASGAHLFGWTMGRLYAQEKRAT